ncbi:MAG: hypothetical protein A3K65_04630 [Euryarchaeota archaeon RBG_16_68_12]|nr:MAG: hypothetical protein A3K65_04630 [Euryarchaeota archaeon RBG_16_68_12]
MSTWTEKYRPRSLRDLVGNPAAVSELERWALAWQKGAPEKRAVILHGPPGTGKTSAALALAADMGWTVVEMNASDKRNADAVRGTALRGAITQTFSSTGEFLTTASGGRKLLILDEADNLFGKEDSGGIGAIVETIRQTRQPVVLIANDHYGLTRRSSAIKGLCRSIKFQPIHPSSVKTVLKQVAKAEGVTVPDEVVDYIAEHCDGDLRSAVNDLELVARGEMEITLRSVEVIGRRDRESSVYAALEKIFRSGDAKRARDSARDLDESPEDLILWVDENLPADYRRPEDLERGYAALSRADEYLARTRRRQQYSLWAYASEMMTAGVAVAREGRYGGGRYMFPQWLLKQSRSRGRRQVRNGLADRLGRYLHTSREVVVTDVLPAFKFLYTNDGDFKLATTLGLGLDEKEVAYLLDEKEDSHAVRHLMERVAKVRGTEGEPMHLPEEPEEDEAARE